MAEAAVAGGGLVRRRWVLLWVIGLAQLMVVLDLTVLNIALPSAQRALGFSTVDRQWVVTAYTLSFGSLLLLGGELSDLLGRKVTFLTGLAGFAVVSAVGGASVNLAMLLTARAFQGAFAALLVPAGAVAADHHLHQAEGPQQGVRHLRGDRRNRRGNRAAARRLAHRVPVLAVDAV
jgi:MFS family permease